MRKIALLKVEGSSEAGHRFHWFEGFSHEARTTRTSSAADVPPNADHHVVVVLVTRSDVLEVNNLYALNGTINAFGTRFESWINNAGAFAFGGSDIGRFIWGIECAGKDVASVSCICSSVSVGDWGESGTLFAELCLGMESPVVVVRHGSKPGGGLLPLNGHTISGFSV